MMKFQRNHRLTLFVASCFLAATVLFAQTQGTPQQQPQPAPAPAPSDKSANPQAAPLTLESTPPPVTAEEEAAIKAFREFKSEDLAKKDQMGLDFLQKYPQSRYRPEVYFWLIISYRTQNQTDKMEAIADKKLELTPDDPQTLALVGSTLPRAMNASTPDPQKRLEKAEQYCQKALDLLPTSQKPDNLTPEMFQSAKNQTAALAYSGLGVIAFRRGKFPDAITNLEQAVKIDPQPDPVNYYILGISDEKTSHFDDAVKAFTQCASFPGGMQTTCTQNAEEARKLGATQLNAPK